ncbi:hypothetical protein, partial [Acidithiobacillus thiooxidans]|uniref:hypothetical protein n=1 Tax=Acidithiobacillus thiooxidans TaxID=930 RepID=UPI001C383F94
MVFPQLFSLYAYLVIIIFTNHLGTEQYIDTTLFARSLICFKFPLPILLKRVVDDSCPGQFPPIMVGAHRHRATQKN